MAIDTGFIVGYGGWCGMTQPSSIKYKEVIGTEQAISNLKIFQVTSASISRTMNVPTAQPYFLPLDGSDSSNGKSYQEARSPIRTGYGTCSFSGEMSFEVSEAVINMISDSTSSSFGSFFKRSSIFHVQFFDDMKTCSVYNCAWNSFTINGQPNSLVTGILNFQSNNGYSANLHVLNKDVKQGYTFNSNDFLCPYWQTGASGLVDFTLGFDRIVNPVYLNNSLVVPSYLFVGMLNVSLNATSLDFFGSGQGGSTTINIGKKRITLNHTVLQNVQYNMSQLSDAGLKSYNWTSIATSPEKSVFKVWTDNK